MITVESTESEFHVKIPKENLSRESLDHWIEWLELSSIAAKSNLSEEEADKIAEDLKANWWEANQHRFLPKEQR